MNWLTYIHAIVDGLGCCQRSVAVELWRSPALSGGTTGHPESSVATW